MDMLQMAGHLTFVLVAFSFLVKDIFWLRCLSVAASVSSIVFNYFAPVTPLWLAIYWNVFFISINAFQLVRIARERIGVRFTAEEKELYEGLFKNFAPFEFMKLMRAGKWQAAEKNTTLISEKSEVNNVMLIYNGLVSIDVDGRQVRSSRTVTLLVR